MTNGSIAKRTANALIQACLPDEGIICESRARKKAKEDIETLAKTGSLEQTHHSRKKVSDEVVEFAVSFILSDYVQRLSWDTKKIRLCSNETIELPKIIRCIGLEDLYVVYKSTCEEQHKTPLGKTKFRELAGKITSGGQTKAISCVNYVDGNLVNDNCERLQMIVDAIFEKSSAKHKFYTEHISHMKNFLKTQFDSHLHHNDGDAFHSLTHALCKPCRHDTTKCDHGEHSCSICIHPENKFECNGCKFPYWLLAQLYDEVNKVSLRNDSSERGNLASQNQQESILVEDVTEEDEEDESSNDSSSSSSSPLLHTDENDSVPKSDSSERGNLERPNRQESILVEEVMEEDEEDESSNDSSRILGDADENDSVPDLPHLRLDDEDERNEILEVLEDSSEKVYLYMKHRARVWCQQEFYNELERELYEECARTKKDGTKCIWVIDFKQKFEAMSARETQTEGFGKRGMSWHGISVIFYVWNEATQQPERRIYYIDQVLDKTNKQDTWSTATLIEAAIAAVKLDLPQLEEAVVCCDNAANYSSKYLAILLCIILDHFTLKGFSIRKLKMEKELRILILLFP